MAPATTGTRRKIPETVPGIADARTLPDTDFDDAWNSIVFDRKQQVVRTIAANLRLRGAVGFERLPLHGITLLAGLPGTGKTSLARGSASQLARIVGGMGDFLYVEIDPHVLVSSSLGRSQQKVDDLFRRTLDEISSVGPTIVMFDEIETVLANRSGLSLDANPFDLHRAVDAALTGLDRLARTHRDLMILATTNFPEALDGALRSRADLVVPVPLPDARARHVILADTIAAIGEQFPLSVPSIVDSDEFEEAVTASDGLDGRQLRKAVAAAVGLVDDLAPHGLTAQHVLEAVTAAAQEQRQ